MSMKQMSKKKKQKQKRRQLNNRFGIMLILLLAVTILTVNLIVFSYSWFTPAQPTGDGLKLDTSASIRSERCTFSTYQGTLVTESNHGTYSEYYLDQIAYNNTPIAEDAEITIPAATTDGTTVTPGRVYFRTNVQNEDTQYPSVISLYHHEFPNNLGIAVTYPSNTYFFNDGGAYSDCFILRNAYVKVKDEADVDGPGLLQVEWFVENFDTSSTKSIRVTRQTVGVETPIEWLYLMYN